MYLAGFLGVLAWLKKLQMKLKDLQLAVLDRHRG
jgi:hypothetical protein